MKLLNHTADKATLELTRQELQLANALIQEGRISHESDSPEAQALEDGIRSIVMRLEEAAKSSLEFGGTH
jgi:soluble cytochrome b562